VGGPNSQQLTANSPPTPKKPEMPPLPPPVTPPVRSKSVARLLLQPLALAVALALAARAAVRIYTIPSDSMEPTLQVGDHIVVTACDRAERGDVVVFRSPRGGDELLVKRVIATPGDVVESRGGRVLVSGHTLPEPYVSRVASSGAINAQIVPADSYFVMGDNRDDSLDSRAWGVVPRALIVGRARMVLWSSAHSGPLPTASAQPLSPPAQRSRPLRVERLFKRVR
jgi:signal peptidase I